MAEEIRRHPVQGAEMDQEVCYECGEPAGDDSMNCECGNGPYCSACWEDHKAICVFAREMDDDGDEAV